MAFKQKHYLMGLALRLGVALAQGCRAGMGERRTNCRRCNAKYESLSHILGQCEYVKKNIMRQYIKICEDLQDEIEKLRWSVIREMRVEVEDRKIIPDLVGVLNGLVLIIDVSVRYETVHFPLEMAAELKVNK